MKINDFLVENKVDEAPQGMISRGLNKLGAKFLPGKWGAQAQGRLNAGAVANKLYKDYYTYLGGSNQQPSIQSLSRFLQSQKIMGDVVKQVSSTVPIKNPQGMSTGEVEKFLMGVSQNLQAGNEPEQSQEQPAAAPGTVPSAQPGVSMSTPGGNNGISAAPQAQASQQQAPAGVTATQQPGKPAAQAPQPAPTVAQGATQDTPAPQPGAPTEPQTVAPKSNFRNNKVEKPAKNTAATGLKTKQPAQTAPQSGIKLDPGSQGGFKKSLTPPATEPVAQPAPKARGGKVAGQVSQTPNAVRKRTARAKTTAPAQAAPMSTGGQAKGNFGATANMGTKLPTYTEEILRKIAIASTSGVPVTRDLYNAASRLMIENNTTLKQMGIKVDLKESTRHTVKLKKI